MTRTRVAVLAALALAIAGGTLTAARTLRTLDPDRLRARIIADTARITGRQLTIGALRWHTLPDLTLDADDVALSNPAGFSRPAMLTARHARLRIGLLPLLAHRVVIREAVLTGADLKLEQAPDGPPNWHFAPPAPAPRPPADRPQTVKPPRDDALTILGITADGAVSWQFVSGQLPSGTGTIKVQALRLREVNPSSTISAALTAVIAGETVALTAHAGGQNHLWHARDRSPWPFDAALTADAGTIALDGTITQPRTLTGYDIAVRAHGPDLARLFSPWPALPIPHLRDLTLDTRLVDRPDGIDIPRLAASAGPSDLTASIAGLSLDHLAIAAPNIDGTSGLQTNSIEATGRYAGQTLALHATLGPIGRLFGRGPTQARAPIALDATATIAGAQARVHGRVAPGGDWSGTAAALTASIPDLAALSPLARRPLPLLHDITLDAALTSAGGLLSLSDAHLVMPQADLRATGTARLAGRPQLALNAHLLRLDLDALAAAALPPPATPATPLPPAPATPPPSPQSRATVIPDSLLPISQLPEVDADLAFAAATIRYHGVDLTGLTTHARLSHQRLDLSPLTAQLAGTPIDASLTLDTSRPAAPRIDLTLAAPGANAAAVAGLLGIPGQIAGTLDLNAALAGTGNTPHALASSLEGYLGIALTGASIDNALLTRALALITPASRLGIALPPDGRTTVACFATRLDARQGVAIPRAWLLTTSRLHLAAAGAIDLRDETFALRLRPVLILGPTSVAVPSRADGPWRDPHLGIEPASAAASAATLATSLIGDAPPALRGLLATLAEPAETQLNTADTGDCTAALAAARDRSAVTPNLAATATADPGSRRERALKLLRRLFR